MCFEADVCMSGVGCGLIEVVFGEGCFVVPQMH